MADKRSKRQAEKVVVLLDELIENAHAIHVIDVIHQALVNEADSPTDNLTGTIASCLADRMSDIDNLPLMNFVRDGGDIEPLIIIANKDGLQVPNFKPEKN